MRSQLYQRVVSTLLARFPQLQAFEQLLSSPTVECSQSAQSTQVPRLVLADKEAETAPCQDPSAPQQPPTPRETSPVTTPRDTQAVDTPVEVARPRASSDSSAQSADCAPVSDTLEERVKARLAKRALGQSYSMEVDSSRVVKRQKLVKSYAKSYK